MSLWPHLEHLIDNSPDPAFRERGVDFEQTYSRLTTVVVLEMLTQTNSDQSLSPGFIWGTVS